MNKPEMLPALYAALAAAQGQFKPIAKNREVTIRPRDKAAYTFRYADLEAIITATRAALSSNGLALVQLVEPGAGSPVNEAARHDLLVTRLMHKDGAYIEDRRDLPSPLAYVEAKEYGAAVTYLRRYARASLLDLAADDDIDQNGQPLPPGGTGTTATPGADATGPARQSNVQRNLSAKSAGKAKLTASELQALQAEAAAFTTDKEALDFWKRVGPTLSNTEDHTAIGRAVSDRRRAIKAENTQHKEAA